MSQTCGAAPTDWRAGLSRLRGAYAPSTLHTAAASFERFEAWCAARGETALPAAPDTLAAYVDHMFPRYTARTVQGVLESLGYVHKAARLADPAKSESVRLAFRRGIRRHGARRRQATPMTAALRDQMLAACPMETVLGRRDRVLLRLGYDTLCRRSELGRLRFEDIERLEGGAARIKVRRSKNDPHGLGAYAFLSAACLAEIDAWAGTVGGFEGPILRPTFKGKIGARGILPETVSDRIEAVAELAGLAGLRLTPHSMRVGAAQDLVSQGYSLFHVMRAGRWKSLEAVALYVRDAPVNIWSGGPERSHAVATAHV